MTDHTMEEKRNHAVLVGLHASSLSQEENASDATLEELEALLETAGGVCVGSVLQNRETPEARTFIGEGKVAEVAALVQAQGADLVVFDNELSPSQQRVLTEEVGAQVIDRAGLILDIFAQRARTKEGRLQVELAQYKYLLPRLTGMWGHLVRQTASGGKSPIGTRGPGETQLETDRRHIRRKIAKLTEDLEEVRRIRAVQRDRREKNEIPVVAIVGYTNAGKSTLLNALTHAGIPARNRLFDTLDTTTRTLEISDTCTVLISDTVGFIRKLPHHLVEAFKATLEELAYADPPCHRRLQPGVAGAGRGGGGPDSPAGGGGHPAAGGIQQIGHLCGGNPPPWGGYCLHLRQDRGGAGPTAGHDRQASGHRILSGDAVCAL